MAQVLVENVQFVILAFLFAAIYFSTTVRVLPFFQSEIVGTQEET